MTQETPNHEDKIQEVIVNQKKLTIHQGKNEVEILGSSEESDEDEAQLIQALGDDWRDIIALVVGSAITENIDTTSEQWRGRS